MYNIKYAYTNIIRIQYTYISYMEIVIINDKLEEKLVSF